MWVYTMNERLLAFTEKFWPELGSLPERERVAGVLNVLGFLYSLPLAVFGLAWLVTITKPAVLIEGWSTLLPVLAMLFLFERLSFFFFVELTPGRYGDWQASLSSAAVWCTALLFGPSSLWLHVILAAVLRIRDWRRAGSVEARWSLLRNSAFGFAEDNLASLIALMLYQRWGGTYPLQGLSMSALGPALWATLARWALGALVWIPLTVGFRLTYLRTDTALGPAVRFWLTALGWGLLADPFCVLATAMTAPFGSSAYLFFLAGLALASLLAHNLSQTVERSRLRTRELESLERLGRSILEAPPDGSGLPQLVAEHVDDMFPLCDIEIRLFPDVTLLSQPGVQSPVSDPFWLWLETAGEARFFPPGSPLPWSAPATDRALVAVPILHAVTAQAMGGICLSRRWHPRAVASSVPAVQSLAAQIASTLHSAEVYRQTLAHERVAHELALAGRIQAGFLPRELPRIPGWQMTATLRPARETSGDFYDVIPLPNDRLGLLIADVADKGIAAALYMALSRTIIRTYALQHELRPDLVLGSANRRIMGESDTDMFVTVFYGILDPVTGTLLYSNAGHNPPYVLRAAEDRETLLLATTGTPLGMFEDRTWGLRRAELAPGDCLVLYTDGITEAQNGQGDYFEAERLQKVLEARSGLSAQEIETVVLERVDEFVGQAPQSDDMALIVLTREVKDQPSGC
jgi:serine phosphatase RsbU (regulator of sigma subunit)